MHLFQKVKALTGLAALGAAVLVMGLSRPIQASIIGSTASTASWTGTPVYQTGVGPTTDSGGTSQDNDNWGGNANGTGGFGALAQAFEVTTAGTLATAQLTMAGSAATFNVELYNLGTPPAGYQAAPGSAPTISQINNVGGGGSGGTNLLQSGDQITYNGVATGQNVQIMTFGGADASVSLVPNNLYVLSLDPTANADNTWWVRGGVPVAAYNTGEGLNADGVAGLQAFEGKSSVRDFDLAVTETAVPEPATIGLFGMACLGLISRRRRA